MFTRNTFKYFELAKKNKNNAGWFTKNKSFYEENVREPFAELILSIRKNLHSELPGIDINPRSVSRPLRAKNKIDGEHPLIKPNAHVSIAEKRTSLFEWNPGIYFHISPEKDDCFLGLGLYMVSSRQLSRLRNSLFEDFEDIDAILTDKKLKKIWGGILGDRYKRFPKGYDPEDPRSKYIWHKQFYMGLDLSRKDVLAKDFQKQAVENLRVAMPFFKWIRQSVGTFKKLTR